MRVKILTDGIAKCGSISALHRELIRAGASISLAALSRAQIRGNESVKFDVLLALVEVVYENDWIKFGKALRQTVEKTRKEKPKI